MHLLDAAETRRRLPWPALIEALAAAVRGLARGEIAAPERLVLDLPEGGRYLVMPAADARLAITKLITVHPANPARGEPAIRGRVVVADARSGEPLVVLDGPAVTARRTAAVSLLGIRTLAPRPPRRVVVVGTGVQAREHAIALHEVHGAAIALAGRDPARVSALCAELAALGMRIEPVADVAAALRGADVVVTATASPTPVLPQHVDDAVLIVAVGAFTPRMCEVPAALVRSRRVVVDTVEGACHEAGDLLQAGLDASRMQPLADALDRPPPSAPLLFKTVGQAAWDLAAAGVALAATTAPADAGSPSRPPGSGSAP